MKPKLYRWGFYILGMIILALGLTLNTKTGLGVSPIVSVAYSISEIWGLNFGDATFWLYALFVVVQLFLRPRREWPATLMQLVVSLVFSRFLNLFSARIAYDCAESPMILNLVLLLLAILCTGIGVSITVNMRLSPNAGDGIVQAIAQKAGWDQGLGKNVFDVCCVTFTCILSLAAAGRVIGVGIGTLAAMVGVGRAVALCNRLTKKTLCQLSEVPL